MKTFLIVFVFYQSIGLKQSNSALTVTEVPKEHCQKLKRETVSLIKEASSRIDRVVAKCKTFPQK